MRAIQKGDNMLHKLLHDMLMLLVRQSWWTIGPLTIKAAEALEDRCTTECAS